MRGDPAASLRPSPAPPGVEAHEAAAPGRRGPGEDGPGLSAASQRVAFYTPLKHPEEPDASGDRQIARALLASLRALGFEPELASRLRTWRRTFEPLEAAQLAERARLTAALLVTRYRRRPPAARPRLWLTYQNYYRAPDFLGPAVTASLAVPYVLVDAAVSSRSRQTPFRPWVGAARLAVRRADLLFAMSPRDLPRLAALRGPRFAAERLRLLPPGLDIRPYRISPAERAAHRRALAAGFPRADGTLLLCVAMMRAVDKLDSYRLLAAALAHLHRERPALGWRLVVVGDGPARPAVEAALAALPPDRVRLLGARPPEALPAVYLGADLFAFPGLGDALGLVYLEAGAAGLPTVACRGPGPEVMVPPGGGRLTDPVPEAFAGALAELLADPGARRRMGEAAARFVATEHSLETFQRRLAEGLAGVAAPLPGPGP